MNSDPVQVPCPDLQHAINEAVLRAGVISFDALALNYRPDAADGHVTWVDRMFWPEDWKSIDLQKAHDILASLREGYGLPLINVIERPIGQPHEDPRLGQEIGWQVIDEDGFHLYHLARAIGVTHVYTQWMEPYYDADNPSAFSYRPKRLGAGR